MKTHFVFCGKIGSGKTTVSRLFAEQANARWNSFGSTVKGLAVERSQPTTREALQTLGAELVSTSPDFFCQRVIQQAKPDTGSFFVLDGLRHASILEQLKKILHPDQILFIFVDLDESIRLERIRQRGVPSLQELAKLEAHSTEIQVMAELRELSDFCVDNSTTPTASVARIQDWIRTNF